MGSTAGVGSGADVGALVAGAGEGSCEAVGVASSVGAATGAAVGAATAAGVAAVGAGVSVGSLAGVGEAWVQAIASSKRAIVREKIRMDGRTVRDPARLARYASIIDTASAKVNAMTKGRGLESLTPR